MNTEHITVGAPPYHAYFEHENGSWYMVWMTHTQPKTSRGHPWHVHMRWSKWGGRKPWRDWPWWERRWGMTNRDFHDPHQAVNEFYFNRYLPRLEHGYRLVSGHLAPGWTEHRLLPPAVGRVQLAARLAPAA